jgi:hypothetical protein
LNVTNNVFRQRHEAEGQGLGTHFGQRHFEKLQGMTRAP